MPTANEEFFDSQVKNAIKTRRFTAGEVARILAFIEKGDRSLAADLLRKMTGMRIPPDFKSKRWVELLSSIRDTRQELFLGVRLEVAKTLLEFAKAEVPRELKILTAHVPIEVDFAGVSAEVLREIVFRQPFQGHLLNDWFKGLIVQDRRNITRALQLGLAQGESVPNIVRRVTGTAAKNFTDGATAISRRSAEAIVRTGVNHVSNSVREQVFENNEDIIAYKRWTSTLDGRTSAICRANDGKGIPVGDKPLPDGVEPVPGGLTPPAHVNCRSILVAVLDGEGILGNRPQVTDTRTRKEREIDFAKQARQEGRPIQEIRKEWASQNVGTVPAETTYSDWLGKQSAEFQDEVLGPTKGKAFRSGDYALDQFVDRKGNELTLEELKL